MNFRLEELMKMLNVLMIKYLKQVIQSGYFIGSRGICFFFSISFGV